MAVAFCPECSEGVKLGDRPQEGQRVTCAVCGADLEVISVTPLELDWAYDEPDEDWGADWDDDLSFDAEFDEDWDFDDVGSDDLELEGEDF
jgi:lysine biosynthesis protein LysW